MKTRVSRRADHATLRRWARAAASVSPGGTIESLFRKTSDGITIKPLYTAADLEGLPHTDTLPGFDPFLRGPHASMYATRPWTIRQYAGFATAEESNAFYRRSLAEGVHGLSVAFDLPTHRGYDSDDPRVSGEVGQAGVAIDTVEDMKILFKGVPLDKVSVSMTMSGAVLPVMAAFLVAAEEAGVAPAKVSGTIQNDILKEYLVRNAYIYPPAPSLRIAADIMAYGSKRLPLFNTISISGYHMQEAGASPALELAFTLANGLCYAEAARARGVKPDDFARRASFFWGVGMDFYLEIAKLRAARLLWAEIAKGFGVRSSRGRLLRAHCQTSGWSLTAQDPANNIVRTTVEALAAVFGGTQSLHTNSFDEALGLPGDEAARIARNTQLLLREEARLTNVIDPWGGSYFMESLTQSLADTTRGVLEDIKSQGGMVRAIESGWAQRRIDFVAAQRQAGIDAGLDVVVGVNKYAAAGEPVTPRTIDAGAVRVRQIARLRRVRKGRDAGRVRSALAALTNAASGEKSNLLEHAVHAMRCRATVGEVTAAMEKVFGRHRAEVRIAGGAYAAAHPSSSEIAALRKETAVFQKRRGRRPRVLVAKLGQDGHDRGAKVVAAALADVGFDVDVGPLFQSPAECARQAAENDVHAVGVSTQAGGHRTLVPALLAELRKQGSPRTLVVVGGLVPVRDQAALRRAGVKAFYGPGASVLSTARDLLKLLRKVR